MLSVLKGIMISKSADLDESVNIFSMLMLSILFLKAKKSLTLKAVVDPLKSNQ
jgi:hypothetical protein